MAHTSPIVERFLMTLHRGVGFMLLVGVASFLVSFGVFWVLGPERIDDFLDNISPVLVIAIFAASAAGFVTSLASAVVMTWLFQQKNQVRMAIDSMSQGVCMFDASERL